MSACRNPDHRPAWVVSERRFRLLSTPPYSWPTTTSLVVCQHPGCLKRWRTAAAYVETLPDAEQPF